MSCHRHLQDTIAHHQPAKGHKSPLSATTPKRTTPNKPSGCAQPPNPVPGCLMLSPTVLRCAGLLCPTVTGFAPLCQTVAAYCARLCSTVQPCCSALCQAVSHSARLLQLTVPHCAGFLSQPTAPACCAALCQHLTVPCVPSWAAPGPCCCAPG
jgi:hypothetical protein